MQVRAGKYMCEGLKVQVRAGKYMCEGLKCRVMPASICAKV